MASGEDVQDPTSREGMVSPVVATNPSSPFTPEQFAWLRQMFGPRPGGQDTGGAPTQDGEPDNAAVVASTSRRLPTVEAGEC
jgi:hypothetical protein